MKNVFGLIFAYSKESDLRELTENRTVASVPFGANYRSIDFILSSMVNSGIQDVGVVTLGRYHSLLDHLESGKNWDLSRKRGGLVLMPPFSHSDVYTMAANSGKMRLLASYLEFFYRLDSEYVVFADGDIIANIKIEEAILSHKKSKADITAVCVKADAKRKLSRVHINTDKNNKVEAVTASANHFDNYLYEAVGVYILSKKVLEGLIRKCEAQNLSDFEKDVLQGMQNKLHINVYEFNGYVAKINTITDYYNYNMELLDKNVRNSVFSNPIYTKDKDSSPVYYSPDSKVKNSLIADGCIIEGEVENSILFRGVHIAKGSCVKNSILMQKTNVMENAMLDCVISDKRVTVREAVSLKGYKTHPVVLSKGEVI